MLIKGLNIVTRGAAAPASAVATELMKRGAIPATLAAFETVVDNFMAKATGLDPERDFDKGTLGAAISGTITKSVSKP